jgi:hypothetical protein
MLSHDPVRTRLREALEHSTAGKFLRGARALWADTWSHARIPTKTEIRGLEQRGNASADWSAVRLLGNGSLAGVRDCRFEGHCVLRLGSDSTRGPLLRDSLIRDCLIGMATVDSVALLSRVVVEDGAVLRHVGACTGTPDSRYCLGLAVHPGSETGARRVFLADGLLLADCAAMAALPPMEQDALAAEWKARLRHCVSDYAFVGAGALVEHTRFVEDCFVGPGAVIRGAAAVRRCIIGSPSDSAGDDPVRLGDNVIVEDCVLEAGVRIDSAAQARRTMFLEHSGAEQGGHVADSVIGPNTAVAKGEVTASLVGPFTGFHHQALLIGALWPEGRGNVGYGANVGSNHTGRKPDQELRPGEGAFFGLGCAIKFPADFSAAPYSLFATGVVTPPQTIAFPFSLITPSTPSGTTGIPGNDAENTTEQSAAGLNEIIPAWMWSDNAFALIRNAYKYADRNRARHHALPALAPPAGSPLTGTFLAADLFAPRVVNHVVHALATLTALPPGALGVFTGKVLPAAGKNFLRAHRTDTARDAYRNYLAFVFFRMVLWEAAASDKPGKAQSPSPAAGVMAATAGLNLKDTTSCLRIFEGLADSVESSLRRDSDRGTAVFADYNDFHADAGQDAVCRRLRADLEALRPLLRDRLTTYA